MPHRHFHGKHVFRRVPGGAVGLLNGHNYRVIGIITTTGWWFGTFFIFPYIGNFIIPTDELHHFSEG